MKQNIIPVLVLTLILVTVYLSVLISQHNPFLLLPKKPSIPPSYHHQMPITTGEPNILHILRTTSPSDKLSPMEKTIYTAEVVQKLYFTILAFPTPDPHKSLQLCTFPYPYRISYYLTFLQGSNVIMKAEFHPTDCAWKIAIQGSNTRDPDSTFLPLFANSLGITVEELLDNR